MHELEFKTVTDLLAQHAGFKDLQDMKESVCMALLKGEITNQKYFCRSCNTFDSFVHIDFVEGTFVMTPYFRFETDEDKEYFLEMYNKDLHLYDDTM